MILLSPFYCAVAAILIINFSRVGRQLKRSNKKFMAATISVNILQP